MQKPLNSNPFPTGTFVTITVGNFKGMCGHTTAYHPEDDSYNVETANPAFKEIENLTWYHNELKKT